MIWRLQIQLTSGQVWTVHGDEKTLREAGDEFSEGTLIWVHIKGFCNTADRAVHTLCVKNMEVIGWDLVEMYGI